MNVPPCPFSNADVDAVIQNMLKNIATTSNVLTMTDNDKSISAMPGAVIASPAMQDNTFSQSYFFHWVRDGAIVISSVCDLFKNCVDSKKKVEYKSILLDYINFVEKIQTQPVLNHIDVLGEPKFNIDGTLWTEAWGRPQMGGANCQALVLSKILHVLAEEGNNNAIITKIYNTSNASLLKANLEYCAHSIGQDSFNMWEELNGQHFSVLLPQRIALLLGAMVANRLNDPGAANYYKESANKISNMLNAHWNDSLGYYFETLNEENKLGGGIDASVLMTLYYAQGPLTDPEFSLVSSRPLSTIFYIRSAFETLYKINIDNKLNGNRGVWIGRYVQDIYDGNQSVYGNPWFMCTNLLAACYYSLAKQLLLGGKIHVDFFVEQFLMQTAPSLKFSLNETIDLKHKNFNALIENLFQEGDAILSLVRAHCATYDDGTTMHMSEQIDRSSGKQVSARDLSWSYSTLLSAVHEREAAVSELLWK